MQQPAPPVSRGTKLLYGSGSIAWGVKERGFSYFLLFFYSQVVGLPAAGVSAILAIALVADAVMDVAVGQLSDNWRSRFGRRHPFMYFSALPAAIAFMLLWNPPDWSQGWLLVYLAIMIIVVRGFLAVYEIPSNALVAELTSDYVERSSFFSYRFFFATWGGGAITLIALAVLMQPDEAHSVGQMNADAYAHYGILGGIVIAISILAAAVGTHNRIPYLHAPPAKQSFSVGVVVRQVYETLSSKSLIVMTLAALCANTGVGLTQGLAMYFNTYLWELTSGQMALLIPGEFIGSALGVALAPFLSKRMNKRNACILVAVLAMAMFIGPLALRLLGLFPENGTLALLITLIGSQTLLIGFAICNTVLVFAMLADVVEENELRTGQRSEGLVLAANVFVMKSVVGMGVLGSGLLLLWAGFPDHAVPGQVDTRIVHRLVLFYIPIQCVLFFAGCFFLSRYPITQQSHEENLRKLAERAAAISRESDDLESEANARAADRAIEAQ